MRSEISDGLLIAATLAGPVLAVQDQKWVERWRRSSQAFCRAVKRRAYTLLGYSELQQPIARRLAIRVLGGGGQHVVSRCSSPKESETACPREDGDEFGRRIR